METSKKVFLVLFFLILCVVPPCLMAVTEVSDQDKSVRRLGMDFNMAEDRRMENIGGVYQPEDLDKYMKRHFDLLNSKIDQLAAQNQRLEQKLDDLIASGKKSNVLR